MMSGLAHECVPLKLNHAQAGKWVAAFVHTEFLHVKPGKGAAFVRTKLKNLLSNGNQEKTFRGGETVNLAEVSRREVQFTYPDGDQVGVLAW